MVVIIIFGMLAVNMVIITAVDMVMRTMEVTVLVLIVVSGHGNDHSVLYGYQ